MAKTLSNSGITSGSVIRAAEISQSIDKRLAFHKSPLF